MRFVCKLGLALCALPLLMGASVYRWVDEDGVVNYTQMKPEGIDAELVSADTGQRVSTAEPPVQTPDADRAVDGKQALTDNQESMLADLRAAEAARQEEIAKVREANCRQARDVLERITSRGRVRIRADDGSERVMPEDERQERIAEAQRGVAANCSETASR